MGEPGNVHVQDLVRVVGIVAPFATRGSVPGENSSPGRVKEHRRPVPVAPSSGRHGRAKQSSGTGPYRVVAVTGPRGQYSGKIHFIEKPGVQDEGGRIMAKHSSDTRVAYLKDKVQVWNLVRVEGIVSPIRPTGVGTWE